MRNSRMKGLTEARDEEIIIVFDVDEILRTEAIRTSIYRHPCTTMPRHAFNVKCKVRMLKDGKTPRGVTLAKRVKYKTRRNFLLGQPVRLRNRTRRGTPLRENAFAGTRDKDHLRGERVLFTDNE